MARTPTPNDILREPGVSTTSRSPAVSTQRSVGENRSTVGENQSAQREVGPTVIVKQQTSSGVTDHGALTGLSDDDHPQYLTPAEGDLLYAPIGTTGVTAHDALTGLGDDDHTQYLNTDRHTALAGDHVTNGDTHDHFGGDGAQVDHGTLAGLADDDHSQYHNDGRAATWHTGLSGSHVTNGDTHDHFGGDGGQVDHGTLAGLGDDDHSLYHTDGRADTWHNTLAGSHVTNGDSHNHVGGDGGQVSHADLSGLNADDHTSYLTEARHTALSGDHVTNGDSHDHSGGDGAQVDHTTLANLNSSNYTHLTSANHTDLTDGGATTLHKHDHGALDGLADDDHTIYHTDGRADTWLAGKEETKYPSSMTVTYGTLEAGAVGDLAAVGGTDVEVGESTGANALLIVLNFSTLTMDPNNILIYGNYDGSTAHHMYVELYNYDTTSWDYIGTINHATSKQWHAFPLYNGTAYRSTGSASLRLRHAESGSASHDMFLDFVALQHLISAGGGVGTMEHGSLSGLDDDDHTQYLNTTRHSALSGSHVTNGDTHNHSGGDGAQIDHDSLAGLADDDHTQYHNDARGSTWHGTLPGAHVTNGDTHNHAGGDGGQIDHTTLSTLNSADYTHLTAANHTDLTDGGATTLHKHDHGNLDGLLDDDHTQYLTSGRADLLYEPLGGGVTDHGLLTGLSDDDHTQYALLAATRGTQTFVGTVNFGDALLGVKDTNASHHMRIDCGSDLTADRILSFVTGDAARTITLSGDPTLANWFDQSVKTDADPKFHTVGVDTVDHNYHLILACGNNYSEDRQLTITTGDTHRTLTFTGGGNPTIGDWFDQAVKSSSYPTFANLNVTGNIYVDHIGQYSAHPITFDNAVTAIVGNVNIGDATLGLLDTNGTHYLRLDCGSNLTADRILSFVTGDAAKTITLTSGAAGKVLTSDADGNASWATPSGGMTSLTQATHGFAVGDVLYHNGTIYAKAKADAEATAEAIGIVASVDGTDNFVLQTSSYITGLSGLTAGAVYYLSDATAGLLTTTEPTTEGSISKPLMIAVSTTTGYVFNMRGVTVGGVATYHRSFVNADLSTGSLTVTHNLGHTYVQVCVSDNNSKVIVPDDITFTSSTVTTIDLTSYGALTGTWHVSVFDIGGTMTTYDQSLNMADGPTFNHTHITAGVYVGGVSSPVTVAAQSMTPQLYILADRATSSLNQAAMFLSNSDTASAGTSILIGRYRNTGNTVQSGDRLGTVNFYGHDGTDYAMGAQIIAEVDGTPGSGDMPGRLIFGTSADGAESPTERMRITSVGSVGIGCTPDSTCVRLDIWGYGAHTSDTTYGIVVRDNDNSVNNFWVKDNGKCYIQSYTGFAVAPDGTYMIKVNGQPAANGYTAFTNYSDEKLKKNIASIDTKESLNKVASLRPVKFRYNEKYYDVTSYDFIDKDYTGFVAQELQNVFPEMVGEIKISDETFLDSNLSGLEVHLVNCVKELLSRIEALEKK